MYHDDPPMIPPPPGRPDLAHQKSTADRQQRQYGSISSLVVSRICPARGKITDSTAALTTASLLRCRWNYSREATLWSGPGLLGRYLWWSRWPRRVGCLLKTWISCQ